ncbi:LPXTG cell wall anchor domain-containing protein [Leucobacter sp. CSA1]|uniref:LPXTG cell wall anchor domain-containing protein n=1 Tax=Leucobacter chromiisoli TaxID=2796471 RepID=A0A934Q8T2_9MICO|nr:LPXTG cell wall anchor domain-containing protein [Leucobacter chromiisoli]MBK0419843.1 LPXTG cell wall anchor domain-containing protein [Leucobacter chromiisoli]
MSRSLSSDPPTGRHRLLRTRPALAIVAFFALLFTGLPVTAAHAAAPPTGTYTGDSTAYTGATVAFDIDAAGMMSGFESESYCFDGFGVYPVQWVGMPATQIEAGVPFEVSWEYDTGSVRPYYELTGTVNADGTASGTGRAGFLPSGTCGGMNFTWTAQTDGVPAPDPTASASPSSLTESELASSGVTITGADFPANSDVSLTVGGEAAGTQTASADGAVSFPYTSSTLGTGTHEAVLSSGSASAAASFTVTEDPVTYDPTASVSPSTLTQSELAATGVTIAGEGFAPDSEVALTVAGAAAGTQTANADGDVSFAYTSASLASGAHEAVLSAAEGTATASFTVTEDPVVYDPTASVTPTQLTESELAETGVTVSGEGFAAGTDVTLSVDGTEVDSAAASGSGTVSFTHTSSTLGTGEHTAELSAAEGSATATFTVLADNDPVYDPTIGVSPASLTVSELASSGVAITGEGFPANADVTLTVSGAEVETASSNAAGDVAFDFTSESLGVGTHAVRLEADAPGAEVEGSFEVTEDPVVYDPEASVAPAELTESELADTGVTVTGIGFPADAEVMLVIGGTEAETATADADGTVAFAYTSSTLGVGTHTAALTSGSLEASADFTVTEDEDPPPPGQIPGTAPSADDLDPALEGGITVPSEARPGETITVTVDDVAPGTDVGVWLFGAPVYLGTHAVDENGQVSVTIPDTAVGDARIAVWAAPDTLVGWAGIDIVGSGGGGGGNGGGSGGENGNGSGSGGDGLAHTGAADLGFVTVGGALLLAAGAGLLLRKRRSTP